MHLKQIKIGKLHTKNNVFLAPLAGYTNAVFRQTCYDAGAGLTFTEMISAKGLCYNSQNTRDMLIITPEYSGIKAVQLFGADPYFIEKAACGQDIAPFDLIDINMGCPMPKIYNNGEGSALLNDMPLASKIIKACKKSGKAVSVKFRIGVNSSSIVTTEFAKMCQDSGADMICIHGRTKSKIYSGDVNFSEIEKAKNAVQIPVIANGGVFSLKDANELMDKTGADGIAVARGAMYAPWIFGELIENPLTNEQKKALVQKQITQIRHYFGERFATVFMRKMIAFYIKGQFGASALKEKLFKCNNTEEVEELLKSITF
ncbi:MAG: tRNA-dihydrouridine synthase [Clostridia bacterium]|nr:tRNA-dihydrouridine synthase [Clostridia bacterium]